MTHQSGDAERHNRRLVSALKQRGCIRTAVVERAFLNTPRHLFLQGIPLERAYADQAVPTKIVDNRAVSSASQPAMIAIMLEQLALQPGHTVLEIGAGTGYNAALMARLVGPNGRVISLDIDEDLVEGARAHLAALGLHQARAVQGDGGYGYPPASPYDRIILTVGAEDISPHWWAQLKPGGRLVLPLQIGAGQKSIAFDLVHDHLVSDSVRECAFIKLRGEFAESSEHPIQVGPDPGLELLPASGATHLPDPDVVYQWLLHPGPLWHTNVPIAPDQFYGGLELWLTLQEPDLHGLVAVGEIAKRQLVPPLISVEDERHYVSTHIVCSQRGMAALTTPEQTGRTEQELQVRQFGVDDEPARRLVNAVRRWGAAGRPTGQTMRICAYPKDAKNIPSGAFTIDKAWTRLVIDWPNRA
jgi:protein-L-isoaspartate(D-aspartate) O-methyltransferase